MKKVNALVLGFAVLLAFGCGGDEPNPDKTAVTQNQRNCHLIREENPADTNEYYYNSQNQLVKIIRKITLDGSILTIDSVDYNANGNKYRIRNYKNNVLIGYYLFDYNSDNLLSKVSINIGNGGPIELKGGDMFEYNNQKQLIKRIPFDARYPAGDNYYTFTYHANGDVTQDKFQVQNNVPVLQKSETFQFTTVKHPLTHIGPLYNTQVLLLVKPFYPKISEYTWVTNADGYPIEETFNSNGQPYITRLDYKCQ